MPQPERNCVWMACAVAVLGAAFTPADAGSLARLTASLPDLPPPPQGQTQWVAKSMRVNGLPMTLKIFRSHLPPHAVFDYYEAQTRRASGTETQRSVNGSWQLLAIKSSQYYITVQAQATIQGSEGTIAVSESVGPALAKGKAQLFSDFPRPGSATIVSRQEYEDDGIESEQLSLSSPRAVITEAQAFVQALTRAGWQVIRHQRMQETVRGQVVEVQRGAQQALLTLQPDHAQPATTAIIVTWRKS